MPRVSVAPTTVLLLFTLLPLASGACGDDPPAGPNTSVDVIGPAGGSLAFESGAVQLLFSPGAVSSETEIGVTPVTRSATPLLVPGTSFDFDPDGLSFAAPVTLTLQFDASSLPAGVRAQEVRVHRESAGQWVPVDGSTVDVPASSASATLAGFSVYGLLGVAATSVALTPNQVQLEVGETVQLTATALASGGLQLPARPVDWATTDAGVATVDEGGLVSAVAAGAASITATVDAVEASATVTVGAGGSVRATVDYATFFGGGGLEEAREPVVYPDGRLLFGVRTYSAGMPATAGAVQSQFGGGEGDTFVAILSPDGSSLLAGTYLGGSGQERPPYGMALASDGDIILVSGTDSPDFPVTAGALHPTLGASATSGYACRLSADLTTRRWCTYIRGWPRGGLALTPQDDLVITGHIRADSNYPFTAGASQTVVRGRDDVFLLKLRGDGSGIVFATALGGSGTSEGEVGLSVNLWNQDVVVGGISKSADFPTTAGAPGTTLQGLGDGFLARLSTDGTTLKYSTMMGGSGGDETKHRNEVLADGAVVVGGLTQSPDFVGASGALSGSADAWVGVLSASGTGYDFLRYLGGSGSDVAVDRAVDAQGRIYVVGSTQSADFPVTNGALQTVFGGAQDAFLTILDSTGEILYSTFLGGGDVEVGRGVEIGADGAVYVVGGTSSSDFPVTGGAWQTTRGGDQDGFVVKLRISG